MWYPYGCVYRRTGVLLVCEGDSWSAAMRVGSWLVGVLRVCQGLTRGGPLGGQGVPGGGGDSGLLRERVDR